MKAIKQTLFAALLLFTLSTTAQNYDYSSAVGVHFGFAQTDFRLNSWEPATDQTVLVNNPLNGVKFGLVWEETFIKGFGTMLALNYTFGTYTSKWKSVNDDMIYPQVKERNNYHQLELAVDWQYKFEIAGSTYIILYTGPTIQAQLALTNTTFTRTAESETQTSISRFDYDDADMHHDYKRYNVTWGVGAGFQYDRFYIRGGYDFGLINPYKISNFNEVPALVKEYGDDYTRYTRGRVDQWHIKLGFFFAQFGK